jgi:glycosyltransferase involved in cell wall biosynthesis
MKCLLGIHHFLDPNKGAPGATTNLGNALSKYGCEVDYFSFDTAFNCGSGESIRRRILYPWKQHEFLCKHSAEYDIIDLSTGDGWIWASLGRPNAKKRHALVTRSHGLEHVVSEVKRSDAREGQQTLSWKYPVYHGGYKLWEVAQSLRLADKSFFLNSFDRDYAINKLGVPHENTVVVAAGIGTNFLALNRNRPSPEAQSPFGIAFVGSFNERKGAQTFTAAMQSILRKFPNVKVSFLGTGVPPEVILKDFNQEWHSRLNIIQQFDRSNLPTILKDHYIHVLPSLSEGFPVALLETMACGLVPIASDIPGPREFCVHLQNSLLVPPRDSDAVICGIEMLLENRDLLNNLSVAAYETVPQYTWKRIAAQTVSIYDEILKKRT